MQLSFCSVINPRYLVVLTSTAACMVVNTLLDSTFAILSDFQAHEVEGNYYAYAIIVEPGANVMLRFELGWSGAGVYKGFSSVAITGLNFLC